MRRLSLLVALALLPLPRRLPRLTGAPALAALPVPAAQSLRILEGTGPRPGTLEHVLGEALRPEAIYNLVMPARPVYDLARLSVDHPFRLALTPDGLISAFSYGIDELRTLRVRRNGDGLEADVLTRYYETRVETAQGQIPRDR